MGHAPAVWSARDGAEALPNLYVRENAVTLEKFVVRLLDADHHLLSWAEVWAAPKPIGRGRSCPFFPTTPTQFVITRAGTPAVLVVHWCDLDLARMREQTGPAVAVGQVLNFGWIEPVWLASGGMENVPMPSVAVPGPVTVGVPTGGIGVRTHD